MNFTELAKERYSCRKFSGREVEREKIDQIIEAGQAAPTAHNNQPYRIFVAESEEAREKISQTTPYTFGAPVFLIVAGSEGEAWVRASDGKNFADVDASIVATHMMLKAQELGLGSTWVGSFDEPLLKRLIPQLADYSLVVIFPLGYPSGEAHPSRLHADRKKKEDIVEYL